MRGARPTAGITLENLQDTFQAGPMADDATGDTETAEGEPLRVLVVEEDRVEGGMLAFHLRREGLIVMLMASEEEAVDAVAWAAPDALVVATRGKELDGLRVIRALGGTPVSVFLASDGALAMEAELEALRLGVADHFTKPLDPALLAKRIHERPRLAARGSLSDLPDGGISGDLALHDVMHLLQLCHRHRMNARLHVELDGDWAVLLVRHGELIDAESPSATGREAAGAAIRRAAGAFVLFPLPLDADELSRDDVIRADLAVVFTEALGRPEPRVVRAEPTEVHHPESPRGPLSTRVARPRGAPRADETLEYSAAPPGLLPSSEKPRMNRRVGVPTGEPAGPPVAEAPAGSPAAAEAAVAPSPAASPSPPADHASAAGAELRRRVPTDAGERATLSAAPEVERGPAAAPPPASSPPRTSESARVMRSQLAADEPELDETTDLSAKSPLRAGARVRRPPTGRFDIGDPSIPAEVTADSPRMEGGAPATDGRGSARHGPPERPFPWLIAGLAVALAAVVIFVVARVATREAAAPRPSEVVAATLTPEQEEAARFGEAVLAVEAGEDAKAEGLLTALLASGSKRDGVMAGLVRLYVAGGRLSEAEQLLGALERQRPDDGRVQALLGVVLARRGQPEDAARAFSRARELVPPGPLADRLETLSEAEADAEPEPTPAP